MSAANPAAAAAAQSAADRAPTAGLRFEILPINFQVKEQRILLINLYLNQIFNTILLNNILKQKHKASKLKTVFNPINISSLYKNSPQLYFYSLPLLPEIDSTNDKRIVSKVNLLLDKDKSVISEPCYSNEIYQGGNKNKYKISKNLIRRKQKTIKKKIRNIKNKNSLKHKIRNKINKCIKKCIKKNNIQKQKQEKQQENKNKYRIKKLLESKIHEKINKLKLNKTKNCSKNKSYRRKCTRKNY